MFTDDLRKSRHVNIRQKAVTLHIITGHVQRKNVRDILLNSPVIIKLTRVICITRMVRATVIAIVQFVAEARPIAWPYVFLDFA
jgi:hypothetical protein